ncbi:hypothetical protein KY363_00840 [Candidatus Woesearchaeota archaeon]|nr:hypothetical protein [Candidatus Woesearchaeota archaeon]
MLLLLSEGVRYMRELLVKKKANCFFFLFLLIGLVMISGCTQPPALPEGPAELPSEPPGINESPEVNETPSPPEPVLEIFDVNIDEFSCKWTKKTGDYGVTSDCVQAISKGTAQGPVGARLELPLIVWSTDTYDCGVWTEKVGALIAVGHTCIRMEGQPEKTNWTVDTGSDGCPLKGYFENSRTHTVKIYLDDELDPRDSDSEAVVCQ